MITPKLEVCENPISDSRDVTCEQADMEFTGAFKARLQNCEKWLLASSCLSVCLSVRMEQIRSHWTDFHEIWHLCILRKSAEKIQVSIKSDSNNGYFIWIPCTFMTISRWMFLRTRNVPDKNFVEKIYTNFLCPRIFFIFFRQSYSLWDNADKYCRAGQATDDDMAHAYRMLDT
jgi:hypothetical protein